MKSRFGLVLICVIILSTFSLAANSDTLTGETYTNSIGMKFTRVEPGSFEMGFGDKDLEKQVFNVNAGEFPQGDFDEHPTHKVKISKAFYMGVYEVTNAQFELFDPGHKDKSSDKAPNAAVNFVTWYQAKAFCQWLSDKEGLPYRLATEAEWEYACRAGTETPYYTGQTLPAEFNKERGNALQVGQTQPNQWGLYDMSGNLEEWCLDWYGPYKSKKQKDPVGGADGDFKIIRGGSHSTSPYFLRSSNRMGTLPEDKHSLIGFRVVIGEMPNSKPQPRAELPRNQQNVKQNIPADIKKGPDPSKPYFAKPEEFIKMPPGDRGPLFNRHNHFISATECPNGDLLAIWHSCITEGTRELTVAGSRLRYGQDEWEEASLFWDAPDRNDHGHALWYDEKADSIYHFNGLADLSRNVALILRKSKDNGATWSKASIIADHGPSRMPIESVIRTQDDKLVLICDKGAASLWISSDEGLTWEQSAGHARGKHNPLVQLKDGRLFAFGREKPLEGKMPISITSDMGKSWTYSMSEFQPVNLGQRSVLLRLKEGPILHVTLCKRMNITDASGQQRPVSGMLAAISTDECKTWSYKRLVTDDKPGGWVKTMNGHPMRMDQYNSESAAYLAICQTPDNVIHLFSSRTHYKFNLKWAMTPAPAAPATPPAIEAQKLTSKPILNKVYTFNQSPGEDGMWNWGISGGAQTSKSANSTLKISTEQNGQVWWRSTKADGYETDIDPEKGYTVELSTQILKTTADNRGVDIEIYDGYGYRYCLSIKADGLYWYEGLVLGSAFLDFKEYTLVADGMDNTDKIHTYRLAVRKDRAAQIYRDGELIAVNAGEYRTPRAAYLQFGAGGGTEAILGHFAFDLEGPVAP